ncbi:carbohydrate kinase family protein [Patescibacteria group bacterium]|nr:carbohydrate kinase family protein [Patescibacteria group bacterium]MBU1684986.1 carbohydrate kinase family protein [Patescibacteria group bacterium]
MKSSLLVTGSIAFDRIAVFKDRFSNHILKGHAHNLNVSFTVEDMEVFHGGTGGNIACNLALLGEKPILLGSIGHDSLEYMRTLEKKKVNISYVRRCPELLTANATIMTDLDDNQITSFYMGAMKMAHQAKIKDIKDAVSMAIIAPNNVRAMSDYADYCFKNGIPFIADPGQAIPAFSDTGLKDFITGAHMLVVNDYEWQMIADRTKWTQKEVLEKVNYLIITYGDQGSKIWSSIDATVIEVPVCKPAKLADPTGCGDAYRAGLMYGCQHDYDIEKSARIGAWLAARCIEAKGTQNHKVSKTDFKKFLKTL